MKQRATLIYTSLSIHYLRSDDHLVWTGVYEPQKHGVDDDLNGGHCSHDPQVVHHQETVRGQVRVSETIEENSHHCEIWKPVKGRGGGRSINKSLEFFSWRYLEMILVGLWTGMLTSYINLSIHATDSISFIYGKKIHFCRFSLFCFIGKLSLIAVIP